MIDENNYIEGGFILLSRGIMQSEIWKKPPEWFKIFVYILMKVNHKDGLFPRGSNLFNFSEERPLGVSYNQVQSFLKWAVSEKVQILTKQKTTRGIVLKVNNYAYYQSLENYQNLNKKLNKTQTETKQKLNRTQTINNNERMKECKNEKIYIELGEFSNVLLTEEEISKLKELYLDKYDEAIEMLSNYIEANGKKYKNHYAVLKKQGWVYKNIFEAKKQDSFSGYRPFYSDKLEEEEEEPKTLFDTLYTND